MTSNKYILSGDTPLSTGGNNSISIGKANLPNIKLKTDSAIASISEHYHLEFYSDGQQHMRAGTPTNSSYVYSYGGAGGDAYERSNLAKSPNVANVGKTSNAGGGTTGSFSLQTEALGSGSPINIQPQYITLKFWKRLS